MFYAIKDLERSNNNNSAVRCLLSILSSIASVMNMFSVSVEWNF